MTHSQKTETWVLNELIIIKQNIWSAVDKAKVIELIVEQLDADSDNISDDDSFMDDLGADSLDTVELIMAFEEEFDIEIPDEDAENIRTVGDVLKYLEDKL